MKVETVYCTVVVTPLLFCIGLVRHMLTNRVLSDIF